MGHQPIAALLPLDFHRGRCAIDRYQYLALMAACLLVTLPLEVVIGARVYRRPLALLSALVPVVIVFSAWDIAGILAQHWTYNDRYVTGIKLAFGMPLEELVFFVVVPICGLLAYEAVGIMLSRLRQRRRTVEAAAAGRSTEATDA